MKISIIGTHGIGKSTLAYQIACAAKERGKNAIVINEVARASPFPLNEGFDLNGATWIVTSQINRELDAIAQGVDLIVCDRSSYDPICYLEAADHPIECYQKLKWFAEEWLKTYDKVLFVLPSGNELIEDGIRSMDKEYQETVHGIFWETFKRIKGKKLSYVQSHRIFDGTISDVINGLLGMKA